MQRAEMEELRQREANMTALQAIGVRKKPKLDLAAGTTGSFNQVLSIFSTFQNQMLPLSLNRCLYVHAWSVSIFGTCCSCSKRRKEPFGPSCCTKRISSSPRLPRSSQSSRLEPSCSHGESPFIPRECSPSLFFIILRGRIAEAKVWHYRRTYGPFVWRL